MGISASQTKLAQGLDLLDPKQTSVNIPQSDILWQYQNKNTILGIPVEEDSRNLAFDSQNNMLQALQSTNKILVWSGYLSPENKQTSAEYREIKQKIADGVAVLISQDKQFVPQKAAFLCYLVYNELSYKLNERYSFYKQELTNG